MTPGRRYYDSQITGEETDTMRSTLAQGYTDGKRQSKVECKQSDFGADTFN